MMFKKIGLVVFLGAFGSQYSLASEPIANKDLLESKYVSCMSGGFADGCFTNIFLGKFDRWNVYPEGKLKEIEVFFIKWLDGNKVYKVHVGDKVSRAGVYEDRAYLIESSDGRIIGVSISFKNLAGEWYIYNLQAGTSNTFIRKMLDMPILTE